MHKLNRQLAGLTLSSCAAIFAGCSTTEEKAQLPPLVRAGRQLANAEEIRSDPPERLAEILSVARAVTIEIRKTSGEADKEAAIKIYNRAAVDLAVPLDLLNEIPETIADALNLKDKRTIVPTSIQGLSPNSPLLHALDRLPIQAVHHSIIGDRGRGDTPNSSDGVVPYWSSHLTSAQSEKIVPTGHDAMDDPNAVEEIRRILLLNLGIRENQPSAASVRMEFFR